MRERRRGKLFPGGKMLRKQERTSTCYENFCIVITKKNVFRWGECTKAVTQREKRAIYVCLCVLCCGSMKKANFRLRLTLTRDATFYTCNSNRLNVWFIN